MYSYHPITTAKKGFITLAFCAFPRVGAERVGELGICSGAGYSLQTAMQDARIDSVATVSGFVDFTDYGMGGATQYMDTLKGTPVEQYRQQIKMASDARQKYFETGEIVLVDGIPTAEKAITMNKFWERAADYYRNQHAAVVRQTTRHYAPLCRLILVTRLIRQNTWNY